jgi:hypothetical protein
MQLSYPLSFDEFSDQKTNGAFPVQCGQSQFLEIPMNFHNYSTIDIYRQFRAKPISVRLPIASRNCGAHE